MKKAPRILAWIATTVAAAAWAGCSLTDPDVGLDADAVDAGDSFVDAFADAPPPGTSLWRIRAAGPGILRGYANAFVEADDGGVVLAGWVALDASDSGTTWLARLGADGSLVWDETLAAGGVGWATAIAPHPEGGFLVAGGEVDAAFLRLDPAGRALWRRSILGAGQDARALASLDDGFLAAGSATDPHAAAAGPWIARLDVEARPRWQKRVAATGGIWQHGVVAARDGGILAAAALGDDGDQGLWIARLDSDGSPAWQRRVDVGAGSRDNQPTVHEAANGDVVVTTTAGGVLVLRFDASGTLLRSLVIGPDGGQRGGYAIDGPDGGLIVAAMENVFTPEGYNLWLLGLSADGTLLWQKSVPDEAPEDATGLLPSHDGGFLALSGGCCCSVVAKLRLDGSFDAPCAAFAETRASAVHVPLEAHDPGFAVEDLPPQVAEDGLPVVQPASSTVELTCP
ncbi:MAG: hypothetical protein HY905_03445 [Deltaproteobacteria bacterium]|nr:hypothetical protein [Deltaproteobacteria bacterium]